MSIREIEEVLPLIPNFVMVCRNVLGEDDYPDANPISYSDFEKIESFITTLRFLVDDVDIGVFDSGLNGRNWEPWMGDHHL